MISQASKELKEVVYKAKEILANHDDIRHALNIAMGLNQTTYSHKEGEKK